MRAGRLEALSLRRARADLLVPLLEVLRGFLLLPGLPPPALLVRLRRRDQMWRGRRRGRALLPVWFEAVRPGWFEAVRMLRRA